MPTVIQPTFRPTNKLTTAMLAGAAYEFVRPVIACGIEAVGAWFDVVWAFGPNSDLLLQFAIMAVVGYIVKDKPNVAREGGVS